MFGLRYHIVTVVSMLLMLGIGFLFGATSGFGPNIVKSQTKTLSKLNGTLTNMVQDSQHDHVLMRQDQNALAQLTPALVASKLARKRVAVILLGDYPAATQAATQSIVAAGGSVVSTTTVNNRFGLLDDAKRRQLAGQGEDLATLYHPLAVVFRAGTLARPETQDGLDALQSGNIISYSGDYSLPVSAVVVVGGWSDDPTIADTGSGDQPSIPIQPTDSDNELALVSTLSTGGTTPLAVIGCEDSDAAYSSVPDFLKANISSVDCVDLPIGALDLPFAVSGERGAYGIKSQSSTLLPESLTGSGNTAGANG